MSNAITRQPELPFSQRLSASIADSARHVGVCEKTIENAIRNGELPRVRLGRRVLIRVRDLEKWLADRTATEGV